MSHGTGTRDARKTTGETNVRPEGPPAPLPSPETGTDICTLTPGLKEAL